MEKKKKVITSLRGCPHCLAFCSNCDWTESANGSEERQELRNSLFRHMRKTGHCGQIETGLVSQYSLIQ